MRRKCASGLPVRHSLIARLQHKPEGPSELWQVPIDGGKPRKLPIPLESNVFAFRLAADGRRVAYRLKEEEPALPTQVWRYEHFLPVASRAK